MQENIKKLLKDCFLHLGEQALYESKDKSYMVKILKKQPDKLYELGEGQFIGETLSLEVSISDISKPMIGDTFVIGECKYKVHTPPLRDNSAMLWKVEAVCI